MTGNILILVAFALGHIFGIVTFFIALRVVGRMKYDLENDLPLLRGEDMPIEQEYTG